jgi:PhnB protein
MQLVPYIFFYGRCAEALDFYKGILGGNYEMMRVGESPMKDQMPPGTENLVMHASFTGGGVSFMASDGREVKTIDPDAGNISLSLTTDDRAEGDRLFAALSAGGKVTMPLSDAFWGGRFGVTVDRFGNEWFLSSP